jgi:DNA-directed RNA polymerase subunit RPC12/RpoP
MDRKEKFKCPHCKKKLHFFFVVKIKSDHEFECQYCGKSMVPVSSKSFAWGYGIGFFAFVIPAQILLYFNHDFLFAFFVTMVSGLLSVSLIGLYVYMTTSLVKSTSL